MGTGRSSMGATLLGSHAAVGPGRSRVAEVDGLADVAAVSGTPVAEHVAVFERAHDQLRRALDAQPGARPDQHQGA